MMIDMSYPPIALSALLRDAPPLSKTCEGDPTVTGVFCDSREAKAYESGGLFVCIRGTVRDAHEFAPDVYRAGCRIFAVTRLLDLPSDAIQLLYEDTRQALARLSAAFYRHPAKELTVVGVTGTKGKTTTCLLARSLLEASGIPTGYIGTIGIFYADRVMESPNSTPESIILQRTMRDMVNCGIRVLLMEVSSQALMMHRVLTIPFDTVLFTNLSNDHIGPNEHPDFDAYLKEKRKLFTDYNARRIILNADDPYAARMIPKKELFDRAETFTASSVVKTNASLPSPSLRASMISPSRSTEPRLGIGFTLSGQISTDRNASFFSASAFLPLPGLCNVHNALAAVAICRSLGLSPTAVSEALAEVSIKGRCESVPTENGVRILIDYAHNETSLKEILETLRPYCEKRLIVLFGSVGGRTKNRRAPMGAVASRLADLCILTSDNPDNEPPEEIIAEIYDGFERKDCPYAAIPDRREAIEYGLRIAETGDVLLLAGKGHETYQLVNGEKLPFSEREIVESALKAMSKA